MSAIEFRVRPVIRYQVTRYEDDGNREASVSTYGFFESQDTANTVAIGLARMEDGENPRGAVAVPLTDPPPGRVMRMKLVLGNMWPKYKHNDEERVEQDGAELSFYPVSADYDAEGNSSVEENRIFGHYSPSVHMTAHVRNYGVLNNLVKGASYYVDFTQAPS